MMASPHGRDAGPLIALTGATGFLGSHVADALLARGYRVRASVRATSSHRWLEGKPVETIEVNLIDPDDCRRFLAGTEGLVHCAGLVSAPSERLYRLANVDTTVRLLEAAADAWRDHGAAAAFILVSSLAAHGPAGLERPAVETNPCRPITAYGRSKREAETALESRPWSFRTAILRPPSLYGPRDREFIPLFRFALKGWTARLGRRMTGLSLVDGRDAAEAAVALLRTPTATGAFFVDDGRTGYDWNALGEALGAMAGRRVRRVTLPLVLLRTLSFLAGGGRAARSAVLNRDRLRDLDCAGWVCDGRRLVAETGFTGGREAAVGFRQTLDFYREEGWL
jgi:nucleoside-diphosphate-sugar epimerase